MVRAVLGVIVGLLAGFAVVAIVEALGMAMFPPPAGFDPKDFDQVKALAYAMPLGASVVLLIGWMLGGFASATTGLLIAGGMRLIGWTAGAIFLGATAFNLVVIPEPVWSTVATVLLIIGGVYVAVKLFSRPGADAGLLAET